MYGTVEPTLRVPATSAKAKDLLGLLAQETTTTGKELKKFTYLIRDLESACELEWQMKTGKSGTKSRGAKFPKFQLKRWECLHYSSKLILCAFLDLYLEGFFPLNFLKLLIETLVTEAFPESPPLLEAMELCELPPHYLLSLIIDLQTSIETETFPAETEGQVRSLWQALNVPFLVAHFDKVQDVLGINDKSESFISKSALSASTSVVYLSEEENIRVEQNRENLCLFAVTVLVKYGLTPPSEDKSKGNSTSALDGSVFNYVLQYAGVSKSMLKRLETDKQKEAQPSARQPRLSKDMSRGNLDKFHSVEPQKPAEVSIDPFVSDLYPASRFLSAEKEDDTSSISTPLQDRTKVRDSMSGNVSSIRKEQTPSQSPGFSFFAKYKQADVTPLQPTPHFQKPTGSLHVKVARPLTEECPPASNVARKKRKNVGVFSAENTWKPRFVLTSEPKPQPGVEWRSIQEPPEVFVVQPPATPYATQTLGLKRKSKNTTAPVGVPWVPDTAEVSRTLYTEPRLEEEEEKREVTLSVKLVVGSSREEPLTVKLFADDAPLFALQQKLEDHTFLTSIDAQTRPKAMHVSASDSGLLRTSLSHSSPTRPASKLRVSQIVPSGPWFTVPERVRCVISADPYSFTQAPNFIRDHADQLPTPPPRPKTKPKLYVAGQAPGQEPLTRSSLKWVQHNLKPTLKLKQDQFCLNYAEYLHYDLSRKQMVKLPSVKPALATK